MYAGFRDVLFDTVKTGSLKCSILWWTEGISGELFVRLEIHRATFTPKCYISLRMWLAILLFSFMLTVLVNSLPWKWLSGEVPLYLKESSFPPLSLGLRVSASCNFYLHETSRFMQDFNLDLLTWPSPHPCGPNRTGRGTALALSLGNGSKSGESGLHSLGLVLFIHNAHCHQTSDVGESRGDMWKAIRPNTCCNVANWHVGMNTY